MINITAKTVRRRLSVFGYRGNKLTNEVKRIVAGPPHSSVGLNQEVPKCHEMRYPFGWSQSMLSRAMRRIFKGQGYWPDTMKSSLEECSYPALEHSPNVSPRQKKRRSIFITRHYTDI